MAPEVAWLLRQLVRYLSGRCWRPLGGARPSTRSSCGRSALPLLGELEVLHAHAHEGSGHDEAAMRKQKYTEPFACLTATPLAR